MSGLFFETAFPLSGFKGLVLRLFGARIGRGVVIKPHVRIKYPWKLSIGDFSWIGEDVWIDNLEEVSIGANCCISQGALLLCGNHNYTKSTFDLMIAPITLEDGAWIGAKSTVCPGVMVQSHAVLTVGSVATKTLESYGIYSGNPAVKVKDRVIAS
jgi:putative colanic acid biosynthesis acetyltransferase WcaF